MPGIWYQMGLHCTHGQRRLPLRRQRLHLLRAARRGDRSQPRHRLGDDQPRPRRQRPLPGEGHRQDLSLRRQAGAARRARRGDPHRRGRLEADHGALDAARAAALRRLGRAVQRRRQREGAGGLTRPRQRLRRRARVDGAHPTPDRGCALRVRRGVELERVPRGGALVRRTQPEPRVRRHAPATSATRHPAPSRSARATATATTRRPAGCRRTTGRAATCRSTRCPTCSTPPRASSSPRTRPSPGRTTAGTSPTRSDQGYRSQRIRDLLTAAIKDGQRLDVSDMAKMQLDTRNPMAPVLVPYLMRQLMTSEYYAEGQRLLLDWDYTQPADSAAAAYFNVVWSNLLRLTFHDQLPESLWPDGRTSLDRRRQQPAAPAGQPVVGRRHHRERRRGPRPDPRPRRCATPATS